MCLIFSGLLRVSGEQSQRNEHPCPLAVEVQVEVGAWQVSEGPVKHRPLGTYSKGAIEVGA
jgi:hypothetical protein